MLCIALLGGCVSHYGAATIVSEPPGAQVINADDGTVVGVTPLTTVWKDASSKRQYVILKLEKPGYELNLSHFWLSMRHTSESSAKNDSQLIKVVMDAK